MTTVNFSWLDYVLFGGVFSVSALVGIYFGCCRKNEKSNEEYLLGQRQMNVLPIAMSLLATHISGVTLIGHPTEVYMYGTQYSLVGLSIILMVLLNNWIYLPVLYNLKTWSSLEYLKLRFDSRIRALSLCLFMVDNLLHIAQVVYVPALSLNQVTGVNINYIVPVICIFCIFCTTFGGFRGVVWNDTLQVSLSLISFCVLFVVSIHYVGGFSNIWKASVEGERIEFFNLSVDPTTRTTVWSMVFGSTFQWLTLFGISPSGVQRYLSLPTLEKAKRTLWLYGFGTVLAKLMGCLFGLVLYTAYANCDPLSQCFINKPDQILAYHVMVISTYLPGVGALFLAGITCTAFGAMSGHLNTSAATFYNNFVKSRMAKSSSELSHNYTVKVLVVVLGIICFGLVFVMDKLGGIVQTMTAFSGITCGCQLALYTLGMLCPCINAKSVLYSTLVSLITMTWIVGGHQIGIMRGNIKYETRPLSVNGCHNKSLMCNNNITYILNPRTSTMSPQEVPLWIYRISFHWFTILGALISIGFAFLYNWGTKQENPKRHKRELYSSFVHKYIQEVDYDIHMQESLHREVKGNQ